MTKGETAKTYKLILTIDGAPEIFYEGLEWPSNEMVAAVVKAMDVAIKAGRDASAKVLNPEGREC